MERRIGASAVRKDRGKRIPPLAGRRREKERKKESEAEGAADRVHPCAGGGRSEAAEWGLPVVGEASERASESEAEE